MRPSGAQAGRLWDHVRAGGSAVVLGARCPAPPGSSPLVVRVRCSPGQPPLAPIAEARRRIEELTGGSLLEEARARALRGLRRRLLGEEVEADGVDPLAEACNRLARQAGPAALVIDAAEDADEASIARITRTLARPGRIDLPVVVAFGAAPAAGSSGARLVDVVRATGGLVLEAESDADPAAPGAAPAGDAWRALPADVVRVLRAAAVLGDEVDARAVADAIGEARFTVLDRLQIAADRGIAIEDHGDLRFTLPAEIAAALRGATLPSMSRALRARSEARAPAPPPAPPAPRDAAHADPPAPTRARAEAPPAPVDPPAPEPVPEDADVDRWLEVAREAEALGAYGEAVGAAGRALALLEAPPETPARRRRRAEVLCRIGRLEWLGAGPEHDFSLSGALDVLRAAQASLRPDDPVALRALASRLIADVCYDLGDGPSLDRALAELTRACQDLHAAGEPYEAARLLNDQAAIYVRMGDPVRAAHLLEQSRRVFEERADRDPIALAEVADTDHLLARIPLHVRPRPGKEGEAIEAAMRHARRAEGACKRLGEARELGRVWETMGRLEIARGDVHAAIDRLRAAASAQHASGDALGLARTTAAMADVLEASSRHREALGLLSDSVRYNLAKGSPLGLAHNRRAFEAIAARTVSRADTAELARVGAEIEDAEAVLGRIGLPGEPG